MVRGRIGNLTNRMKNKTFSRLDKSEEGPYKGFLEKRFWVNEMKKKESIYFD